VVATSFERGRRAGYSSGSLMTAMSTRIFVPIIMRMGRGDEPAVAQALKRDFAERPGGLVTNQRSINSRLRRLRVNRKAWIAGIEPLTFSPRQRLAVRTPFGDFTMEDADRNLTRSPNKPRGLAEPERTREITAPSVFDTNGRDNSAYGLMSRFEERGFSELTIKTLVDA
jgi:hypothetical protein